ncbi:MAG: bifunctional diguanylate cyclase/phosphodiesterase [Limnospira sp.]
MESNFLTDLQQAILALVTQLHREVATRILGDVESYLDTPHKINQINASAIRLGQLNSAALPSLQRHFWEQMQIFDTVSAVAFADETGDYVGITRLEDGSPTLELKNRKNSPHKFFYRLDTNGDRIDPPLCHQENYDPRDREWYKIAKTAAKAAWTPIYQYTNCVTVQFGLMAVLPVYDATGKWLGVLGCDLSLSHIGRLLDGFNLSPMAATFIVEPSGMLVTSSKCVRPFAKEGDRDRRLKAESCGDRLIEATTRHVTQQLGPLENIEGDHQFNFQLDNNNQFVDIFPFRDGRQLNWLVLVVIPETKVAENQPISSLAGRMTIACKTLKKINFQLSKHIKKQEVEIKEAVAKIHYNSFHDSLTQLPNRAYFMERLRENMQGNFPIPHRYFSVFLIDLDRFKIVNESLGHLAGDLLLIQVSQRLQKCLRDGDMLARFGGDEFAIFADKIDGIADSEKIARRVLDCLKPPFRVQGEQFSLGASIGIALNFDPITREPYERTADILRGADLAMYRAKHGGRNCYAIFDTQMHANLLFQLQLENDLRHAIARGELHLHYQPVVSLLTGEIVTCEALIRWKHPIRGWISPIDFIPVAEETGLIVSLGAWVLREACAQMHDWLAGGWLDRRTTVSVNMAGLQFTQPELVAEIGAILEQTGLSSRNLRIEVTESAIAENALGVADRLSQLREMGVGISVDDFGTGHSSLSRLQNFPVDALKIDRSFIDQITRHKRDQNFVEATINFAHSLDLTLVAEGIETQQQWDLLRAMGCDCGQGYLISRPADAIAMTQFFRECRGVGVWGVGCEVSGF